MAQYVFPRSLGVDPRLQRHLKGQLAISFGGSLLLGRSFEPVGLDSLWSLVGAIASLDRPFTFEIGIRDSTVLIMGAYVENAFALFQPKGKHLEMLNLAPIAVDNAKQLTVDDERHGTFYWLPSSGTMSFEELIRAGNRILLATEAVEKTLIGQGYSYWIDGHYVPKGGSSA